MKHLVGYKVRSAHQVRQCHPETCCCTTDFVVEATYRKGIDHSTDTSKIVYSGDLEGCETFIKGMPQLKVNYSNTQNLGTSTLVWVL